MTVCPRGLSCVPDGGATYVELSEAGGIVAAMVNEQVTVGAQGLCLDPYCSVAPRLVGITDANALLSSVDNDCRKGFRSRLRRMTDFGVTVLYAPDHVYGEVYRRLPKIAQSSPMPLDVLRAHFEEYYLPIDFDHAETLRTALPAAEELMRRAERLRALGDPTRLRIAHALHVGDELCV